MSVYLAIIDRLTEQTRFEKLQERILREIYGTMDGRMRKSFDLLAEARKAIIDRIAAVRVDSFNAYILPEIQKGLEDAILRYEADFIASLNETKRTGWDLGAMRSDKVADFFGIEERLPGLSDELLRVSMTFSADQVKNLTTTTKAQLNLIMQRAVLTGDTPFNVMGEIREFLKTPEVPLLTKGPMRGAQGIAFRAETIVRTEGLRMANLADKQRSDQYAEILPEMDKTWMTSRDNRVRDSHAALEGVTIPYGEDFSVNGNPAAYPMDPRLPPEESINCRCTVVMVPPKDIGIRGKEKTIFDKIAADKKRYGRQLHALQSRTGQLERGGKAATKEDLYSIVGLGQKPGNKLNAAFPTAKTATYKLQRDQSFLTAKEAAFVRAEIKNVESLLDKSVLDKIGDISFYATGRRDVGGYAVSKTDEFATHNLIAVRRKYIKDDPNWAKGTIAHEIGHHVEYPSDNFQAVIDFYLENTKNEPETRYMTYKVKPDKFVTAYSGKRPYETGTRKGMHRARYNSPELGPYEARATELISEGLEWMVKDPFMFYQKAPDHFFLTLRFMRGEL